MLSFVLRRSLEESPEFARMRSLASRQPFRELLRTHGVQVLVGCAVLAGTACFTGLFFSHLPAYLAARAAGTTRARRSSRRRSASCVTPLAFSASGWLGDRIPPRYLLRAGRGLLLVFAYPFYAALEARAMNLTLVLMLAGLCAGLDQRLVRGAADGSVPDAHPLHRRRAGVQHRFTIFSGMAPLVATTLIRETGDVWAPAI